MPTARKSSRRTQVAPKTTRSALVAFRAAKSPLVAAPQERKGKTS